MFGRGLFSRPPTILTPAALAAGKAGYILDQYGAQIVAPGDTNENTLRNIVVPGGVMGVNGALRIWTYWSQTNNANVKTGRVRFGAANPVSIALTSLATGQHVTILRNRNAANSQMAHAPSSLTPFTFGGLSIFTSAIDTSADVTLTFTAQKATAGDTMNLEAYCVEVLPFGASIGT